MLNSKNVLFKVGLVTFLVVALFVGCSDDDDNPVKPTAVNEFNTIMESGQSFLTTGVPVMKAVDLYNNLNDGDSTNNPFILSIRGAADYAAGHIAGAVNIGYKDIAKESSLSQLPTNKQIVVVCYTGHTASFTTMFLNMMGYDAICLKFGMTSWTVDPTDNPSITTVRYYDSTLDCGGYPVVTGTAATSTYTLPTLDNTTSSNLDEIVRVAADNYLSSTASAVIKAVDVYNNLNDGNTANDPFILSVRGATDFAAGHVAGAINIPWREIGTAANLAKLPTNKQIIVICYTGHTASMVTMYLNTLGYDAISMKFGMTSWTIDPTDNPSVATNRPYDVTLDCGGYPVE